MGWQLVLYCDKYEIEYLFDFEDGSVSIGVWICFILFFIAFFSSFGGGQKEQISSPSPVLPSPAVPTQSSPSPGELEPVVKQTPSLPQTPVESPANPQAPAPCVQNGAFCPSCGSPLDNQAKFCGMCGFKR